MNASLALASLVSIFFFTHEDPQITMNKQYKAYATAQAFKPGSVEKYRNRALQIEKPMLKSTRLFLDTNVDWELYAKSIFNPNWDTLTKNQKRRFIELLQKVYIKKYGKLFSTKAKFSVSFRPTEYKMLRGENFARVKTTISSTSSDLEFDIDFVFHEGPKRWALCDVYIDGVSKSRAYRSQVRKIYKKKGYEGVISAFKRALNKA